MEHKIKDYPLLERSGPPVKEAKPTQIASSLDKWNTIVKKGKGSNTTKVGSFPQDNGHPSSSLPLDSLVPFLMTLPI